MKNVIRICFVKFEYCKMMKGVQGVLSLFFLIGMLTFGCTTTLEPRGIRETQAQVLEGALVSDEGAPAFISPPIEFDNQLKPVQNDVAAEFVRRATAKSALCYINHLNYVVARLGEMKDLIVLEQEYENLTDNNLNLAQIEDIETVEIIQAMMDLITEMEKDNVASIGAQLALVKAKKDAIWKALPSPGGIGGVVMGGGGSPVGLVLAITSTVWTSYQNYQNAKAEAETAYDKEALKLATEKLEQLNELNKELFYSQWRLMKKYDLTDYSRVTRNESMLLQNWAPLSNVYTQIESQDCLYWEILKNNEFTYSNLHQYWIARASAATDLYERSLKKKDSQNERRQYRDDVIFSCQRYFSLLKDAPIIRKDPVANSLALLYVTMQLQEAEETQSSLSKKEKEIVKQWLRYIEANTRIVDAGVKYALVELYKHREINDWENATRLAKSAFMEVQACLGLYNESKLNIFCTNSSFKTTMGDWVTKGEGAVLKNCQKKDSCALYKALDKSKELESITGSESQCCENCKPMISFARYVSKWQHEQVRLLPLDEWYCLFDAVISCLKKDKGALKEFIQGYKFPLGEDDFTSCVQRYVVLGSADEKVKVQNCLKKIRLESPGTQMWKIKFPKKWFHNQIITPEGYAANGVVDLGALSVKNNSGKLQEVKTSEEGDEIVLALSSLSIDSKDSCSLGIRVTNVCQIELLFGASGSEFQLKSVLAETNSGFKKEFRVQIGLSNELSIVE